MFGFPELIFRRFEIPIIYVWLLLVHKLFFSYKIDQGSVVKNWPALVNYCSGLVNFSQLTYLIPKFKKIEIRPRQRSNFEFLILLSINTYLTPKFKNRPRQRSNLEFC